MPNLFLMIPLLALIVINIPGRKTGEKICFWIAIFVNILQIDLAGLSVSGTIQGGIGEWLHDALPFLPLSADLYIDIYSAVVLGTIGLVALVALIADKSAPNPRALNLTNLVLILQLGMNGIVMVRDLFSLYVFLEITAAASFILISIHSERDSLEGAFKYFIMSAIATIFLLMALALVFITTGSMSFANLSSYMLRLNGGLPLQMALALLLFTAGLSIKAGIVPFHGWLPDAYSSAPTPISILLAGIVTKVTGVYTVLRLFLDVFQGNRSLSLAFLLLGTLSILVGAIAAIGQKDYKRMLAYSSISQVGYIIVGAALGTPLGLAAALLHFVNHALAKSLLFANSQALEMQTGTRDMDQLGGVAAKMPITAGTSVVGFLSTAGIPPLSGFWSKLLIILALFQADYVGFAAVALLSSVLTLAYFLILQRKVFFGKLREEFNGIREAKAANTLPALLLAGITILLGVLFPLVLIGMQAQHLL